MGIDHTYEYSEYSGDKNSSAADASKEHESTASNQYVPVEGLTDAHASTSAEVPDNLIDTHGKFITLSIRFLLTFEFG